MNQNSKKKSAPKKQNTTKFLTKDDYITVKPLDEVKALFRNYFSKNRTVGHIMSKQDVKTHVLTKLNAKEDALFATALKDLQREGFIEIQDDEVSLKLTQKGADSFKK